MEAVRGLLSSKLAPKLKGLGGPIRKFKGISKGISNGMKKGSVVRSAPGRV